MAKFIQKIRSFVIPAALAASLVGLSASNALGQGTGDQGQIPNIGDTFDNTAGTTNGSGGGSTGESTLQDLLNNFDPSPPEVLIENERLQPFVGRSIERFNVQEISAHPRSNAVSAGDLSGGGGGGGFSLNRNAGRTQGQGQGNTNIITRKSLRTRLVSRIDVRVPVSSQQVSSRFQNRLSRIPATSIASLGVQVQVDGMKATLTGTVRNLAERNRVEQMARLEPGIYKIDNQIQVQQ